MAQRASCIGNSVYRAAVEGRRGDVGWFGARVCETGEETACSKGGRPAQNRDTEGCCIIYGRHRSSSGYREPRQHPTNRHMTTVFILKSTYDALILIVRWSLFDEIACCGVAFIIPVQKPREGNLFLEKERDFFPNVPTLSDGIIIKLENLSFVAKPGKLYAV